MYTNIRNQDIFAYVDNFTKQDHIESTFVFKAMNYDSADISFIVPTYKRVDTLRETLDSILSQEGEVNYTVIVVDNNPERDDETEILMANYTFSNISYVKNNENLGMAGNWNRGILLARSKWVCLLHDDDVIISSFLKEMLPYLSKFTDAAILQTRKFRTLSPCIKPENVYKKDIVRYYALDFYQYHIIDVPSGIFYNREIVIKEGGFNSDFYPSLDYVFHIKLALNYNVYVINKPLTWYREGLQNASKLTATQIGWIIVDFFAVSQLFARYKIPQFIIQSFLELKTEERIKQEMRKWDTSFELPYEKLVWKGYPKIVKKISRKIIQGLVCFNRVIFHK